MPHSVRPDRRAAYTDAMSFAAFLESVSENESLWKALAKRAVVPDELAALASGIPGRWHLLVLLEDWCGDAVNTVPVLERLVQLSPNLTLRVLRRDENLDLMDAHLTDGKRAIPIVMVLDEQYREVAWWGPRPEDLQDWATTEGAVLPKPERYKEIRRWYAVDRGRSTVEEVLRFVCESAGASCNRLAA